MASAIQGASACIYAVMASVPSPSGRSASAPASGSGWVSLA